jgi:hypothetical protein
VADYKEIALFFSEKERKDLIVGEKVFSIHYIQEYSYFDSNYLNYIKFKIKLLHIIYTEITKLREVLYIIYTYPA